MAKKTAAQPSVTASKKKQAKKADTGLSAKGQAVIDYLFKQDATIVSRAIDREKVWKACDVGMGVISTLKAKGLMERVDHEDGSKSYVLTAEGKKLASK